MNIKANNMDKVKEKDEKNKNKDKDISNTLTDITESIIYVDNINNQEKQKENNSFSNFIRPLFLFFLKIKKLKEGIIENKFSQKNNLANLLNKLIIKHSNKETTSNIMNDIENKIKELIKEKNFPKEINFINIIDLVFDTLDEELNEDKNKKEEFNCEDYDQFLVYRKFKKFFEKESIIQNMFYIELETIRYYDCCKLQKYSFNMHKYIFCDILNKEKEINLYDIIFYSLNHEKTVSHFCQMCNIQNKNTKEKNIIFNYPEMLIIILKNNNNSIIKFESKIKLNEYEYNIHACITKLNEEEENYDLLFFNNSKWIIFKENYKHEEKIDEILYPEVLFCQRGKEIKNEIKEGKGGFISNNKDEIKNFYAKEKNKHFNKSIQHKEKNYNQNANDSIKKGSKSYNIIQNSSPIQNMKLMNNKNNQKNIPIGINNIFMSHNNMINNNLNKNMNNNNINNLIVNNNMNNFLFFYF